MIIRIYDVYDVLYWVTFVLATSSTKYCVSEHFILKNTLFYFIIIKILLKKNVYIYIFLIFDRTELINIFNLILQCKYISENT